MAFRKKTNLGVLDFKASVRVATTANITLSGLQTIDGVALAAGDRVLVKDQTTGSENGIYVVASAAWSRASDADSNPEVTPGFRVWVEEGTTHADTGWILTTNGPITVGTTALSFASTSGAAGIDAGAGLTKSGDTLAVGANADGSIIVNADDVQVGVLATDSQHGNRGGGALHAAATTATAGFMSAADKTKLDGVATGATNTPLTSTAPSTVTPDDAAAVGTSSEAARADHVHAVAAAVAGAIAIGDTAAEGISTSFARADHVHSLTAPGAPADVTKATASAGASTSPARADHKHDVATAAPVATGDANAEGTSTSLARADHVHALGGTAGGDLTGTYPNPTIANDSVTAAKANTFISAERTGTGSAENIAHGLGVAPSIVLVVPTAGHDGAGGAGTQMPTITEGVHDATNVVVTVSAGAKYKVLAWA